MNNTETINRFIKYLIQDIDIIEEKDWLAPVISSYIKNEHPEIPHKEIFDTVNSWFSA